MAQKLAQSRKKVQYRHFFFLSHPLSPACVWLRLSLCRCLCACARFSVCVCFCSVYVCHCPVSPVPVALIHFWHFSRIQKIAHRCLCVNGRLCLSVCGSPVRSCHHFTFHLRHFVSSMTRSTGAFVRLDTVAARPGDWNSSVLWSGSFLFSFCLFVQLIILMFEKPVARSSHAHHCNVMRKKAHHTFQRPPYQSISE